MGVPSRMGVCGFGFGKRLATPDCPIEEAIRSALPLGHRFVFAAGKRDDDTRPRLERIDPKVAILGAVWPDVTTDGAAPARRIASHPVLPRTRSRWLRLGFHREVLGHGFKG